MNSMSTTPIEMSSSQFKTNIIEGNPLDLAFLLPSKPTTDHIKPQLGVWYSN